MEQLSRVFILNGYDAYGGSYMLYQIGRICHETFGKKVFLVQTDERQKGSKIFQYPSVFPHISLKDLVQRHGTYDLLICSPADSHFHLGSQLTCQKIMYLQGISTYSEIDREFDMYISVSRFVKEHALEKFGIDTPIIHPFIDHNTFNQGLPWDARRNDILVLCSKRETIHALSELRKQYKKGKPQYPLPFKKMGKQSQKQLASLFGQYKYYLTLSPVEGFGLTPLEAMASGTAVFGFDAYGGREYFTNDNAFVVPTGRYDLLLEKLQAIQNDQDFVKEAVEKGRETARKYTFDNFKYQWVQIIKQMDFYRR